MPVIMCFENATMMKTTCIDTLLIAFPIRVGMKKVRKGIWKWPHIRPARSNRGFGICEEKKFVIACCLMVTY